MKDSPSRRATKRTVIDQSVLGRLGLDPNDVIAIEQECIMLRPVTGSERLSEEQGVWTLRTGQPISAATTDGLLWQIRHERDSANLKSGDKD